MKIREYLDQMESACQKLNRYVTGIDKDTFLKDEVKQDAVYMVLIHVGESAARLEKEHPDFMNQHPEVPWHAIKGLRNRIAHGYLDIVPERVWETVVIAVPEFHSKIQSIKEALNHQN